MTEIELSMEFHCVLSYSNLHEESPLVEFRLASFHMKLFSSEIAINNHLYSFDHNKRDSLLLISLEAVDNTYKRSSEHLTVSVTLAWLNNCGNEDGGSCLAQRRGLDPVICLFPQIPVPHPINSVLRRQWSRLSFVYGSKRYEERRANGVDNLTYS
ncbi:hypothetical protein YC2023_033739 [Brassica napus]